MKTIGGLLKLIVRWHITIVAEKDDYLLDLLVDLGFEVFEASSSEEALDILANGPLVDVLLTDHLMPGMTGVELAYAVRARQPGVKVLIVSGFAEAEGIDPSLPRLTKPFVQAELARALAELRGAQM